MVVVVVDEGAGLAEDKALLMSCKQPPPRMGYCDIFQEASSCLNVNTLLEGKAIFNLTMAKSPVPCRSSLAYENPFEISLLLTSPQLLGVKSATPHMSKAATLPAHGSYPHALIKPPF